MQTVIFVAPLFQPGEVVATPGVLAKVPEIEIALALNRHLQGDWGDVSTSDKRSNNRALRNDGQILSVYYTEKNRVKFWIITEADRSSTTVLLPDEY